MKTLSLVGLWWLIVRIAAGQAYQPVIEPTACPVKVDARLVTTCGYLVVPENRHRSNGRKIKIPFVFVRRPDQDAKRHVSLFTTGGPGYSTIGNIDSVGYRSGLLKYGGFIAFDQRGTQKAQPCLDCPEVDQAVRRSYRAGLKKDSLVLLAVKQCRSRFATQGIDLSAYTTLESAEDINDLRLALRLDSLNLIGISYSGGLMLTVVRKHPEGVRALVLNSPLPSYVNYEEDALLNANEALEQVFAAAEANPAATAYQPLRARFQRYFTAITGKKFTVSYLEKGTRDSLAITYTKSELLDVVMSRLNGAQAATIPAVIDDLIKGKQAAYIREMLDGYFAGEPTLSLGMRYSVYCTEQLAYADPALERQQRTVVPWLAGYEFNNVSHPICDCWKVKPEPKLVKTPVYANLPALLAAGDIDPNCRPFYNRLINRDMPNSQFLLLHNAGHAPGFSAGGVDYVQEFLANPYKKIRATAKDLLVE